MLTHKPMAAKLHYGLLGWEEASAVVPRCAEFLFSLQHGGTSLTKTTQPHALEETTAGSWSSNYCPNSRSCPPVHSCSKPALTTPWRSIIMRVSCSHLLHLQLTCATFYWRTQRSCFYTRYSNLLGFNTKSGSPSRWRYWAPSIPTIHLVPGSQLCRANPPELYKWNYICGVASHMGSSIYTWGKCKLLSKLMEVSDVITDSSQPLQFWHQG